MGGLRPSEKFGQHIDNGFGNSFNSLSFLTLPKGSTMAEVYVVVSKIKKAVKDKGLRTGGDYIDALSKKIEDLVNASISKVTTEGKKKTLGAEDL